jgi:hypothetical protein
MLKVACSSRSSVYAAFVAWTVLAILLAAVPTTILDKLPVICPLRLLGMGRCPGCGMLHALCCLGHLQIKEAVVHNVFVVVVAPLLAYEYLKLVRRVFFAVFPNKSIMLTR